MADDDKASLEEARRSAEDTWHGVRAFVELMNAYDTVNLDILKIQKKFAGDILAVRYDSLNASSDCLQRSNEGKIVAFENGCAAYMLELEKFASHVYGGHGSAFPGIGGKFASAIIAINSGETWEVSQAALERTRTRLGEVQESDRERLKSEIFQAYQDSTSVFETEQLGKKNYVTRLNRALALEAIVNEEARKLSPGYSGQAGQKPKKRSPHARRNQLIAAAFVIAVPIVFAVSSFFRHDRAPGGEQGPAPIAIEQTAPEAHESANSAATFIVKQGAARQQDAKLPQESVFTARRGDGVWHIAKMILAHFSPKDTSNQAVAALTGLIVANPEKFGLDKSEILPAPEGGIWLAEGATVSISVEKLKAAEAACAPAGEVQAPAKSAGETGFSPGSGQSASMQTDTLPQAQPDSALIKPDSTIEKSDSGTGIIFEHSQNAAPAILPSQKIESTAGYGLWVLAERMAETGVDGFNGMERRERQGVVKSIMNELVARKNELGLEGCLRRSDNYRGGWMLSRKASIEIEPMRKFLAGPGKQNNEIPMAPQRRAA